MYDLIVLGGGPAGLTATVYAIRKRLECTSDHAGSGWQDQLPPPATFCRKTSRHHRRGSRKPIRQ